VADSLIRFFKSILLAFFLRDIDGNAKVTFNLVLLVMDCSHRQFNRAMRTIFAHISPFALVKTTVSGQGDKYFKTFEVPTQAGG